MKTGRYIVNNVNDGTTGSQTESLWEDEEKAQMCRGSRCLVLMTVCLGLICVLLLVFITLYITTRAERDLLKSYKNTVEEFNQTTNTLQDKNTDLMTEKDQLKNNFNSLSQKKPELETRVNDFPAEKTQLETNVKDLTAEKSQLQTKVNSLSQQKLELETRVNKLTAEQSQLDTNVKDLTAKKSQLQTKVNSLSQQKSELETRVNELTAEQSQLDTKVKDFTAEKKRLNQKMQELESTVTSLSEELKKEKSKQGNRRGPECLFKSSEPMSWSESRQFCRDRGADLVIINTEEKQKRITSFMKERVWIGLSDIENKGIMKWVDNSTLNQTFWFEDRLKPNNESRNEDCVELMPLDSGMNWNDLPCSAKRKGICEKFGLRP